MVVPYNYEESSESQIDWAFEFINKVLPVEEERDFLLKSLSTCLDGKLLENFILLIANGRNGKDTLITNVMKFVLGNQLYYDAPNYILTDRLKTGANPEVANMHKRRMIVYNEPPKKATLNCATVKQLTGCENMPARGLYQNKNETKICASQFSLLNSLLSMDSPDDAMLNRLFVIKFRSMFRTEERLAELPEDSKYAYLVDSYYKTTEFLERIKLPCMNILLSYYKLFRSEGRILRNAPKSIMEASKQYISDSDDFVSWFQETYVQTTMESDFVKMKDIYAMFKCSDLWYNMNKSERRRMNKTKLQKDIQDNPTLRAFYRERKIIGGKNCKNIIVKYKVKETTEEEYDEE